MQARLAYGDDASERLDVFTSATPNAPVLVYLHGGYRRALDKRDQSFVATPFVDAGAMVVLPNHALCPAVTIEHIVMQMVRALAWVWRHAAAHGGPARIVVAGHSAGGHLAAMLLACDWRAVAPDLPADLVQSALAISGVFELEPLRHVPFLASDLGLDAALARRVSRAAVSSRWSVPTRARSSCARASSSPAAGPRSASACPGAITWTCCTSWPRRIRGTHALALQLLGQDRGSRAANRASR